MSLLSCTLSKRSQVSVQPPTDIIFWQRLHHHVNAYKTNTKVHKLELSMMLHRPQRDHINRGM